MRATSFVNSSVWVFACTRNKQVTEKTYLSIMESVSNSISVPISDIMSSSRKREIVEARVIITAASYRFKKSTSSSSLGRMIKKDHATVLHYKKSFKDLFETNADFRLKYDYCLRRIENGD